jgi:transglutaminase-like putative cysteine protease
LRLRIHHRTDYSYDRPLERGLQHVRLFPRPHAALDVLRWDVIGPGGLRAEPHEDGSGNLVALISLPAGTLNESLDVSGEVETRDLDGWLKNAPEPLPPAYYLRTTPRTTPDAAIRGLAAGIAADEAGAEALSERVRAAIDFVVGATGAQTTAAEALAAGAGVCQDHAHVLLAAARAAGIPARYVSGYYWSGFGAEAASHAWAELHLGEAGWLGLDAANRARAGEAYVRLAVGLDYADAAPITGVRTGGGRERLDVAVAVRSAAEQ